MGWVRECARVKRGWADALDDPGSSSHQGQDPFTQLRWGVTPPGSALSTAHVGRPGLRRRCSLPGETGTGKELVAHALHTASDRARGPFIAINAGTLLPGVLASELFGYKPGMFTGGDPEGTPGWPSRPTAAARFAPGQVSELPYEAQVALLQQAAGGRGGVHVRRPPADPGGRQCVAATDRGGPRDGPAGQVPAGPVYRAERDSRSLSAGAGSGPGTSSP